VDDYASMGLPCIRFNYLGCGNSAQDEFSADQMRGWVACIHEAIEALKDLGNVERVILVGFRLGFSLAAKATEQRDDVYGLVAISPVIRGRNYVRELRLLSKSSTEDERENAQNIAWRRTDF
jgi:pimeloyl-ACP methyl ester carboxylesterase